MRRGQNRLNGFKFDTFSGRFSSDGAASMAVRGLNARLVSSVNDVASEPLAGLVQEYPELRQEGKGLKATPHFLIARRGRCGRLSTCMHSFAGLNDGVVWRK